MLVTAAAHTLRCVGVRCVGVTKEPKDQVREFQGQLTGCKLFLVGS